METGRRSSGSAQPGAPDYKVLLAKLAGAALSGSMVRLLAFFGFAAFTAFAGRANRALSAVTAAALFSLYLAQIHFLTTLGRHAQVRRLRTWQLSLSGHALILAAAYWIAGNPIVFILLVPELLSALLHLPDLHYASSSIREATS